MRGRYRRTFLRSATRGLAVATAAGLVGSARASTTVSVSGRVVCADGEPAGDVTMEANTNSHPRTTTDGDGYFSLDVPADAGFYLGMYEYKTDGSPPKRDGVPFVYDFGERSVGKSDANLGTLRLPETHRVTLRVLHADGEPAPSAEPDIAAKSGGHWFGAGPSKVRVTRDGYLKLTDTDYTGVELGGAVLLSAEFAETGAKYEKSFNVTEPTDLAVQAGKGFREASTTTTESTSPATTKEPGTTASAETPTTSRSTTGGTAATTVRKSGPTATAPNSTRNRRRGFFSNGNGDASAGVLEDPYFLTVGGFALSVGGILHQLVRGK
ncbi:hypothetical protein [Haladaptatus salinisoli]|uniref:hypothetical protein n=1 Tax=Haladaptatus salinisoli TaxID=2884876 RepID=UPI001D09E1CA|nr:hypothetical protein [Haladaptatus salinisoli]